MSALKGIVLVLLLLLAVVLQVSFFGFFNLDGVVPNLALLVVVAVAITRGPEVAAPLGFLGGLLLDLAPPADHVVGRWALALVVAAYVAGRVRQDVRPTAGSVVATVAASSFVGTSVFALSGIVLQDPALAVGDVLQVVAVGVFWDVLLTPFVLPLVMGAFRRLEPARATA